MLAPTATASFENPRQKINKLFSSPPLNRILLPTFSRLADNVLARQEREAKSR
jgi:hypothetical protein